MLEVVDIFKLTYESSLFSYDKEMYFSDLNLLQDFVVRENIKDYSVSVVELNKKL